MDTKFRAMVEAATEYAACDEAERRLNDRFVDAETAVFDALRALGVDRVVIVTGPDAALIVTNHNGGESVSVVREPLITI